MKIITTFSLIAAVFLIVAIAPSRCINAGYIQICGNEPTPTPEPTITSEASPSAMPTSTPGLTTAGAPEAPKCVAPTWGSTVIWIEKSGNDAKILFSEVANHVDNYVIEYKVGGVVYTTTNTSTYAEIHANGPIQSVRVAGNDNGCVGPFGAWTSESLSSGRK